MKLKYVHCSSHPEQGFLTHGNTPDEEIEEMGTACMICHVPYSVVLNFNDDDIDKFSKSISPDAIIQFIDNELENKNEHSKIGIASNSFAAFRHRLTDNDEYLLAVALYFAFLYNKKHCFFYEL